MTRTFSRLCGLVGMAIALTAAGLASGSSALASSVGPTRIGPHQYFAGEVNGQLQGATVKVACPISGTHGRALSGQTVSVTSLLVIGPNFGYTGERGRAIAANLGTEAPLTILFTTYNRPSPFPTDVPVPCSGTGIVVFAPVPGSHGAKSATVTVSYENIAVGR